MSNKTSNINIYCDESRHTNADDTVMIIGAMSCPHELKSDITKKINLIRKEHNIWREIGWKTISPNHKDFYFDLLRLFISQKPLSFRCIVVKKVILDHEKYSSGDNELGFYKLYYQMLVHWLRTDSVYRIYLDWQQNKDQLRFKVLRDILRRKLSGRAKIQCLEPVVSHNVQFVQLTDLLIGAVGYEWNNRGGSSVKVEFCKDFARSIGLPRLNVPTTLTSEKVNIFHFVGR